jgi:hypothetical protein
MVHWCQADQNSVGTSCCSRLTTTRDVQVRKLGDIQSVYYMYLRGRDCSVGIVTRYKLHDSGSNPDGVKRFSILHTTPDQLWGPSSLFYKRDPGLFSGGKVTEVCLTTHPNLASRLRMSTGTASLLSVCVFVYVMGRHLNSYFTQYQDKLKQRHHTN